MSACICSCVCVSACALALVRARLQACVHAQWCACACKHRCDRVHSVRVYASNQVCMHMWVRTPAYVRVCGAWGAVHASGRAGVQSCRAGGRAGRRAHRIPLEGKADTDHRQKCRTDRIGSSISPGVLWSRPYQCPTAPQRRRAHLHPFQQSSLPAQQMTLSWSLCS